MFAQQHVCCGQTLSLLIFKKYDTSHNTQPTAVGNHCRYQGDVISKNNVGVLAREEGLNVMSVKPLKIKTRQGFDLPTIYS